MGVTERGSSAALDTVVFVVLIGAAVTVLGTATPTEPATGRTAEETGDVLASATTTVNFSRSARVRGRAVSVDRRAHGTYAELIAAATVADPARTGDGLTDTGGSLTEEVREATRRVLGARAVNVQVTAVWRPYPGADLSGTTAVGGPPPRDASVAAAAVTVPSGFPNATARALAAADRGEYGAVAAAVSRAVVEGLFPHGPTDDALHSEGPDRILIAHRYRHAADALGTDVTGAIRDGDVAAASRKLAAPLAAGMRRDLERRYDTPAAAARAVRVDRVRIVVRTWSP